MFYMKLFRNPNYPEEIPFQALPRQTKQPFASSKFNKTLAPARVHLDLCTTKAYKTSNAPVIVHLYQVLKCSTIYTQTHRGDPATLQDSDRLLV